MIAFNMPWNIYSYPAIRGSASQWLPVAAYVLCTLQSTNQRRCPGPSKACAVRAAGPASRKRRCLEQAVPEHVVSSTGPGPKSPSHLPALRSGRATAGLARCGWHVVCWPIHFLYLAPGPPGVTHRGRLKAGRAGRHVLALSRATDLGPYSLECVRRWSGARSRTTWRWSTQTPCSAASSASARTRAARRAPVPYFRASHCKSARARRAPRPYLRSSAPARVHAVRRAPAPNHSSSPCCVKGQQQHRAQCLVAKERKADPYQHDIGALLSYENAVHPNYLGASRPSLPFSAHGLMQAPFSYHLRRRCAVRQLWLCGHPVAALSA